MFTLAQDDNSLNFFFVDDITQPSSSGSSGGEIVGIAGAIPGPSSIGGTVKSGAVVNDSFLLEGTCTGTLNFGSCGPDITAYIAAHEGGHWMGLYHTTEQLGAVYGEDPISDTGSCACTSACVGSSAASKCYTGSAAPSATSRVVFPANCNGKDHKSTDCDESTSASCAGNTGAADANCSGSDNVMFWEIDNKSTGNFSAQQGSIVRANVVVQ